MLGQPVDLIWADLSTSATDVVIYTLTHSGALAAVRSTARISSSPAYHPENIGIQISSLVVIFEEIEP